MLSPSHIQKIQSLDTSKPLLLQLPGVTCQVCAAFGSLQDSSSFKTRLRRRTALQTVVMLVAVYYQT